jgi:hypothetical protein
MKNTAAYKKTVRSLCALSFIFAALCASSYAWLGMNIGVRQVTGDMSLGADFTEVIYNGYMYDIEQDTGVMANDITNIIFNPYDLIFLPRNRYTPVFVLIEVKQKSQNSMNASGTFNIVIERAENSDDSALGTGEDKKDYASTIMRFSAGIAGDLSVATLNQEFSGEEHASWSVLKKLYMHVDNLLYSDVKKYKAFYDTGETSSTIPDWSNTFTTIENNAYSKTNTITLPVTYTADDWVDADDGDGKVIKISLYITYDDGLVKWYKKYYMSGGVSGTFNAGVDKIPFINDLVSIKISYGD